MTTLAMSPGWRAGGLQESLVLQHGSIAVENAIDAGEVARNKPEAQAKGIE